MGCGCLGDHEAADTAAKTCHDGGRGNGRELAVERRSVHDYRQLARRRWGEIHGRLWLVDHLF